MVALWRALCNLGARKMRVAEFILAASHHKGNHSICILLGAILWACFCSPAVAFVDDLPTKRVLILYTHRVALPITQQWDKGIRASLQAEVKQPVTIDVEYVDSDRLGGKEAIEKWFALLLLKYNATPPDLIIPVFDPTALAFANHAQGLFPKSYVVFCSINETTKANLQINERTAGVIYKIDYVKTIELAKQLLPQLRKVIVVCGSSRENMALLEDFKRETKNSNIAEFEYWVGMPVQEMRDLARSVPTDNVILYLVHDRDRDGRSYITPQEVVAQLADSSSVPVFGLYDTLLGSGILGGVMAPVETQGKKAGSIAAQILNGRSPAELSFTGTGDNQTLLDWRQLRRWNIDEHRIPQNARIMFRQPSLWERYWHYILMVIMALTVQTLLIGGLWINRKNRIQAERALARQYEFEKFLSDIRSHFIHVPLDQLPAEIENALNAIQQHLGLAMGAIYEVTGQRLTLRSSTSPGSNSEFIPMLEVNFSGQVDRWEQLNGGEVRFVCSNPSLGQFSCEEWLNAQRPCSGWVLPLTTQGLNLGVALFVSSPASQPDDPRLQRLCVLKDLLANILARERSEKELQLSRGNAQQLARKLLTAQEDERRRLARELHDDLTQRLAAAAIAAGRFRKEITLSQTSQLEANTLTESLIEISKDVHQFSRRLHPSILEELGLLDAIRHECNAAHLQSRISLTTRYCKIPSSLPKDIQLCLYRIVQESLRNMVKHSRATEGEIVLDVDAESVRLQIKDNGRGISAARENSEPGLGLIAMQERVQLVGGMLDITSVGGTGTCVDVRIPMT